ncbi:MAG: NAD(P)/FAD-dependent oxidoreductase, partial [Burkholderiales bacterium]|nr:NAD(P)/FAD-dependent oxidoreductase [Burkholderiales bacterium]
MGDTPHAGPHRIVIVGGGAGGLELATRLGDKLGKRGKAHVTLIDKARTHLWKPLLHEIAAGSMDLGVHELDYLAQSHWHHFVYRVGEMVGLDRARREVQVAPFVDDEGRQVTPGRVTPYDTLVIAVGSFGNDFGTLGVKDHAIQLDTPPQAKRFHSRLVNALIRAHAQHEPLAEHQLQVAIIGAGATGVELAAELHNSTRQLVAYGLDRIDPKEDIRLYVIEAADRILPALPPRLSEAAEGLLVGLGVVVRTSSRVAEVTDRGVRLATGELIPAELVVWAAGVKAPDFLKDLDGLETNRINQLVVRDTLQTTRDERIFALGDCAACPLPDKEGNVPPRAQAAHQQASFLLKQLRRHIDG